MTTASAVTRRKQSIKQCCIIISISICLLLILSSIIHHLLAFSSTNHDNNAYNDARFWTLSRIFIKNDNGTVPKILTNSNSTTTSIPTAEPLTKTTKDMITNTNDDSIDKVASSIQQLWPVQVLEEYKQWHSHDVLLTEDIQYMKRRRKFAIMYYSCPDRTGNIFHNMYNSILWSIITNRTLLVKFDETDGINTIEQCADIIQLSSWVPLYDVWSAKLDIQTNDFNDTNTNNDNNSDDSNSIPIVPIPIDTEREIYDGQNQVVIFPQIQDIYHHDKIHITRNTWRNDPLDLPNYRLYIQNMGPAYRIVAQKLYNEGVDFLMGMLFREVFVVNQAIRDRITNSTILKRLNLTADTFSLALHSRHTVLGDIGDFINEEITCLQKLLPSEINRSQDTCIVFLMSDRQLTIDLLSVWLRNANCTPISAAMILSDDDTKNNNTDDNHPSRLKNTEHGERAGYGFIEDLLLSSHARTGYIGDIHRSSFMLLVEVMSYDRTMEAWADGRYDVLNDMIHCVTKQRSPSGYDYGPGTPTFKHHTLLQPLRPVEVFDQYKKWHGITSLTLYPDETLRTFAIAYYQCPFYGSNDNATVLFKFLNHILWGIVTNRTILWKEWDVDSCLKLQQEHEQLACTESMFPSNSCNNILEIQKWLPSYEDWSYLLLHLDDPVAITVDKQIKNDSNVSVSYPPSLHQLQEADLYSVVMFPNYDFGIKHLLTETNYTTNVNQNWYQQTAIKLYDEGHDFLYGMLFHDTISIQHNVTIPAVQTDPSHKTTSFTVAVDGRQQNDDETIDIAKEIGCLESVLGKARNTSMTCDVYLISDSNMTQLLLEDWLTKQNCSMDIADHTIDAITTEQTVESAEVRGRIQFFQELDWASMARTAFVGHAKNTLSHILLERIEYKRRMEIWKLGRDPPIIPTLAKCTW